MSSHQTSLSQATLVLDASKPSPHPISPYLFGKFCEHLGRNIYHGMEAQILFNPTFSRWRFSAGDNHPDGGVRETSDREQIRQQARHQAAGMGWPDAERVLEGYLGGAAYGWFPHGHDVRLSPDAGPYGDRAQRIETAVPGAGIAQWTHLPLHRTRGYQLRLVGRAVRSASLRFGLRPVESDIEPVECTISLDTGWNTHYAELQIPDDWPDDALYEVHITTDEPAHFVLDRMHLYPEDHIGGADPDVVRLLRDSRLTLLRWPGGNFVSGYHWRDGVGPVDARPVLPNPAWGGLEFNLFGTDEFIAFCREVGCEPMICLNAGNGTAEEAAAWVEYCNGGTDTPMGRLRAENGHPEPYGVKFWEIGNEIYGRWQVGWTTAAGNADRYRRFREAMLRVDPDIELMGCGHGNAPLSDWNQHLIEDAGPTLSIITDHILTGGAVDADTDPAELVHAFLGQGGVLEGRYAELQRHMQSAGNTQPRLAITELQLFAHFRGERRQDGRLTPETMPRQDTITEALYYATIVNACIRLPEFARILTHSATVNHGGGLRKERERVYPNPVYHARAIATELAGGYPLPIQLDAAIYSTEHTFGSIPPLSDVPVLDAVAVEKDGALILLIVHRGMECGPVALNIRSAGMQPRGEAELVSLAGETWYSRNRRDEPNRIVPHTTHTQIPEDGTLEITLQPYSLTRITLKT